MTTVAEKLVELSGLPSGTFLEHLSAATSVHPTAAEVAAHVRTELSTELDAIMDARKLLRNKRVLDPATGIETIYDDNGAVLYTRDVYEDKDAAQPYRGQGADRVERYEP